MIQRTADDLVGAFAPRGHAELLSEFAWPLPSTVITELLGVPGQDRERFLGWVHAILGPGAEDPQDIAATFTSVVAYLTELIDGKRGQPCQESLDVGLASLPSSHRLPPRALSASRPSRQERESRRTDQTGSAGSAGRLLPPTRQGT